VNLFGKRQVEDPEARRQVADLADEIRKLESVVRQIEGEQILMHDQVRKWMRRAVAAERAAERHQEPHRNGGPVTATPAPSVPLLRMRGARARILARRLAEAHTPPAGHAPDPEAPAHEEPTPETEG
jgi:hypothetical protein